MTPLEIRLPLDALIVDLCSRAPSGRTICPTDAAKAYAETRGEDELGWRTHLSEVRRAAVRLALALLWQIEFGSLAEEFCTVRTSPGRRAHEEVKDGLPDRWQARLWWRSPDSFFSVPRP